MVIHVRDHDVFEREGDDLRCRIAVSFVDAALGTELSIPVVDGSEDRRVVIPEGTQPGHILRLKNCGMPSLKRIKKRGDLFVQVMVRTPTHLSQRQRELLMEFAEVEKTAREGKARDIWDRIRGIKSSI